jgi:hypothetical protein
MENFIVLNEAFIFVRWDWILVSTPFIDVEDLLCDILKIQMK